MDYGLLLSNGLATCPEQQDLNPPTDPFWPELPYAFVTGSASIDSDSHVPFGGRGQTELSLFIKVLQNYNPKVSTLRDSRCL